MSASGGARLSPKAWSIGGEAQWQVGGVKNLACYHIGQWHFGGGDQPTLIGGLKQIISEFWQLTRALHSIAFDKEWRQVFRITKLPRVDIEHKSSNRTLEARQCVFENDKPAAG